MQNDNQTLWEILWDSTPNGLVVVNKDMRITTVNPAFCKMVKMAKEILINKKATDVLGETDVENFKAAWREDRVLKSQQKRYHRYNLLVRNVIFPLRNEGLVACVMVDCSNEWYQRTEMHRIKRETIEQINEVVNKQMHVAQEIAGLLGETSAETKVSLLRLRNMLEQEIS